MSSFTDHDRSIGSKPIGTASRAHGETRNGPWLDGNMRTLALAALCGGMFGFLLQKGGVAKFDILLGALLLENFVVAKVILSAIAAGMVLFHLLAWRGLVKAQITKTAYGSNVVGGLLFGVGFALLAYCPGTNAAALGQGNYDALVGMAGLVFGSYLFILARSRTGRDLTALGEHGKLTIPDLINVRQRSFLALAVPTLVAMLAALELLGP